MIILSVSSQFALEASCAFQARNNVPYIKRSGLLDVYTTADVSGGTSLELLAQALGFATVVSISNDLPFYPLSMITVAWSTLCTPSCYRQP